MIRAFLRYVLGVPIVALIGAVYQQNVQSLSQQIGTDKLLNKWEPAMQSLADHLQSPVFIFFAGCCTGALLVLWIDYLIRGNRSYSNISKVSKAESLSHALQLLSGRGMDVRIDIPMKRVQVGFNLHNSSDVPLRYNVENISVVIDGKTVMNPPFANKGGVIPKGSSQPFHFPPIPFVVGKSRAQAEASIVYRYGSAEAGEPPVREANYRVDLLIAKSGGCPYTILEENDAEI